MTIDDFLFPTAHTQLPTSHAIVSSFAASTQYITVRSPFQLLIPTLQFLALIKMHFSSHFFFVLLTSYFQILTSHLLLLIDMYRVMHF